MSGDDCLEHPEACDESGRDSAGTSWRTRLESVKDRDSSVLVIIITVLSAGLVLGMVALAYFWKKSEDEKILRKDIEKECCRREDEAGQASPDVFMVNRQPEEYPTPLTLVQTEDEPKFDNEGESYTDQAGPSKRGKPEPAYGGMTKTLTETDQITASKKKRKGGLKFKYKNMGGFTDVGNVHPKNDYKKDESNQCLWDIVMVRLSLINEDFVHKSRYLSGQPFGFKHDILVAPVAEDEWEQEEVDSYQSGGASRQGSAF